MPVPSTLSRLTYHSVYAYKSLEMSANAQEIIKTIIDRGYLSKAEIQHLWSLSDDEYAEIQAVLGAVKVLQPGPSLREGRGLV